MYRKRILVFHIIFLLFFGLSCGTLIYAQSKDVSDDFYNLIFRQDLKDKLSPTICQNTHTNLREFFFSKDIYEAGIAGGFVNLSLHKKNHLDILKIRVKKLLKTNAFLSYSYGFCEAKKMWYVLSPAPKSLKLSSTLRDIQLDSKILKTYCSRTKLEFVSSYGGTSKSLAILKQKISLGGFDPGFLSLRCKVKTLKDMGFVLWYLVPIKDAQFISPPFLEKDSTIAVDTHNFFRWINFIRVEEGLRPLYEDSFGISAESEKVVTNFSIVHDIKALKGLKKEIKNHTFLLGENRVVGRSLYEMASNLWNSASHRNFFLNKLARKINIKIKKKGGFYLAVFLLGK